MGKSPLINFAYFGSKGKLIERIKEFIKDGASNCNTFIDGFGGSGAVTLNIDKDIFDRRIINDLNPRLFLIHKVLSDPVMAYQVLDLIEDTELSKSCFLEAKKIWKPYEKDIKTCFEPKMLAVTEASAFEWQKDMWKKYVPEEKMIELAAAALVLFKQSFNGLGKSPKQEHLMLHKKSDERLVRVSEDILKIDSSFQYMAIEEDIYIKDLDKLEKFFGVHNIIKKEASKSIEEIKKIGLVEDVQVLKDNIENISFARKLIKIAENSPVIGVIPNEVIIEFSQSHPALKNKLKYSSDNKQIRLDT
ncbi:Kiwa anti-phage protein KwaB-like domain-containing protein, partial [Lacrimispora amygdalina]|uniref:Kiwa anti-phage protein KwaB-like domain-containing protein n=1 Tax=Lacrimispora amygdalina TaxID=253257 RepID=UPI0031F946D5